MSFGQKDGGKSYTMYGPENKKYSRHEVGDDGACVAGDERCAMFGHPPDTEHEGTGEPQGREQADAVALQASHAVLGLAYHGAPDKCCKGNVLIQPPNPLDSRTATHCLARQTLERQ